jgi:hypothetical protein
MPVKTAVDNDHKLFITCFQGWVPVVQVLQAMDDSERAATGVGTYRGLVIFERDVDLSEWDGAALITIRLRASAAYRRLGLQRGESAAVVNFVPEAGQVMRLWNAFCAFNWDIDFAYNIFWDFAPALAFLDAPPALRERVFELAMPQDS